ncbi:MAG: cation:proton antiporter [Spirochaetia bacterium]|nr:cation:proton antiporter [Spirochaetia bacterium]
MQGLLSDIGITVIISAIIGIITTRLKQPIILGYLITGVIIGPQIGPALISDPHNIEVISEIGLVLLLFIIGLEMNPQQLISAGKKIIIPGLLQFPVSALIGYTFFYFLRESTNEITAIYMAIFCSLSSTAIVVKLLYDKLDMDTRYGKISVGILIFQDIWAILVLALQPDFQNLHFSSALIAIIKSISLLVSGFLFSRYILQNIFFWIHKNPEMVVAVSIGWCGLLAATGHIIGLSMEMGALIAGISISTFPYSIHVTARVNILRDFFMSLFFVSLGLKIPIPEATYLVDALWLLGFLFTSRFISVLPLMLFSGSSFRTSFLSSLTLMQISEFSLVIGTIGLSYSHIEKNIFASVLFAMSFSAILSSYVIKYNTYIYRFIESIPCIKIPKEKEEQNGKDYPAYSIIILGCHRGAREMLDIISFLNPAFLKKILVIDYNMESLRELQVMNVGTLFGDISSLDTLKHAHIENAEFILSTIPDMLLKNTDNEKIIKMCKDLAPKAQIIATAESSKHSIKLKAAGAGKIILPYSMMGDFLANYLLVESKHAN